MATTMEDRTEWLVFLGDQIRIRRAQRAHRLKVGDYAGAARCDRIVDKGLEGWQRINDRVQVEGIFLASGLPLEV